MQDISAVEPTASPHCECATPKVVLAAQCLREQTADKHDQPGVIVDRQTIMTNPLDGQRVTCAARCEPNRTEDSMHPRPVPQSPGAAVKRSATWETAPNGTGTRDTRPTSRGTRSPCFNSCRKWGLFQEASPPPHYHPTGLDRQRINNNPARSHGRVVSIGRR